MVEKTDSSDESLDRISGLPDSILLQILSFMPTKDAIKTGLLSKRWEFLWSFVPDLFFDVPEDKFVNFVDRTLILYKGSKVRKFDVIFFDYRASFASFVDSLIRFVVTKKVEELDLELYWTEDGDSYELPRDLYSNDSLTRLRLSYCHFRPSGLFSWRLLTSLYLDHISLRDNVIQDILLGSPLLEVLDLNACSDLMHLNITSPSLKKLTVHYEDYDYTVSDSMLEISAPNLQSLAILGIWHRKCRLMNLPCLVEATLAIQIADRDNGYEWRNTFLRELLESLRHVKDLTIDTWCIQCYSPDLYDFDGENYWKSLKPFSQCLLHNLKTVKMFDYVDGHHEMDLVQFLLKHAMVLEKMVIYSKRLEHLNWRKLFMPEELLEFTQKILSFPRASPRAVILFS
ncbi:hypothetical protein HHK36_023724 [Tetracentron sinense]|uniref:F-box domain-containing protein n=1 Tax=Tetracentron sinense TaxID=13715 RepID=A0A834YLV5_TETSI|nr:hypothetical protein HHK36_023724 [Tetracentron sinense]